MQFLAEQGRQKTSSANAGVPSDCKNVPTPGRYDSVYPFTRWYKNLRDARGQQKILARINRMKLGNLGDHRSVGEGAIDLRIAFGPGYRIYFG